IQRRETGWRAVVLAHFFLKALQDLRPIIQRRGLHQLQSRGVRLVATEVPAIVYARNIRPCVYRHSPPPVRRRAIDKRHFSNLRAGAVIAIISSPSQGTGVLRQDSTCSSFPKKPGYQPGFLVSGLKSLRYLK